MHRNFHRSQKQFQHIYRENNKTKPKNREKKTAHTKHNRNNNLVGIFTELCKLEPSVRFIRRQNDEWISVVVAVYFSVFKQSARKKSVRE